MPLTIGSNISSLKAQRRLSEGTSELSKTFERLSSGLRINKAADDAAGLAISESLKSDKRVFNQGVRNFNDGISLLNIADGAIENLSNITIRLKELAEQSANGTYSVTQRKAIDKEAQALSKEYTRIVQSTKFNGVHLLDGNLGSGVRVQGGYGVDGSILAGVGGATATGNFSSVQNFTVGTNPTDIASFDLNGDGVLDIVSADSGSGRISVLLGRGDGTFLARTSFQAGSSPSSVAGGDFNGDGNVDIVLGSSGPDSINILIGNGDGTFKQAVSYAGGSDPKSVVVGDFNSDGYDDIAAADYGSASVSLFMGSATGTLSARVSYTAGAPGSDPAWIETGDINRDGNLDLITANQGANSVSILLGSSNGTFGPARSFAVTSNPNSVSLSDFNNDGILDFAVSFTDDTIVETFQGRSDGTYFRTGAYDVLANTTGFPNTLSSGDVNGDGISDLLHTDYIYGSLNVLLGKGDGTFRDQLNYSLGDGRAKIRDFNGDGVQDIAMAASGGNSVGIMYGISKQGASILSAFDLTSKLGARQALPVFDQKIQQLAKQRGQIGAFQSRVQVGINNLQTASENYAAAESRIRDTDIADESSKLLRLNILQQAAASVLGQANLQPQLALQLLS